MASVLENIDEIVKIKNDLKYLIFQVGGYVDDDFSTYCDELRRLINEKKNNETE